MIATISSNAARGLVAVAIAIACGPAAHSADDVRFIPASGYLVMRADFAKDGSIAISGSADGRVALYDLKEGKKTQEIRGFNTIGTIHIHDKLAVFTTGPSRVSGGKVAVADKNDWFIHVWDLETGKELPGLGDLGKNQIDKKHICESAQFTPDGTRILAAYLDNTMRLWDLKQKKELFTLEGHTGRVGSMSISADGKKAVTGSWYGPDPDARVWDLETGKLLYKLAKHTRVGTVVISSDGNRALTLDDNPGKPLVRVWDLTTGKEIRSIPGQKVRLSPDGKQALIGAKKVMELWDLSTGEKKREFLGHTGDVYDFSFSADASRTISCSGDRSVRLWDTATGKQIHAFQELKDYPMNIRFSADGSQAAGLGLDSVIVLRLPK